MKLLGGSQDAELTPLGGHWRIQLRSKPVTETLSISQVTWNSDLEASWDILDTDFETFCKTLRDEKMSQNHNSEKVRMFRTTCVFAVKNNLGPLDNAHAKLA